MEGRSLQSYPAAGNVVVFDPPANQGSFPAVPRPFTIDKEGRIVNDMGLFLCGYYITYGSGNLPAEVGTCDSEFELQRAFLICKLAAGDKVTCEIPAISCVAENPNDIFADAVCEKAAGSWSTLSIRITGPGHVLHIGPEDAPSYYERTELGIQRV
jgi:hypothetical protein